MEQNKTAKYLYKKVLDNLLIKEYCKVHHKRCQSWFGYGLWPHTLAGSDLFKTNYSRHHDSYTTPLLKQVFCKFVLKKGIINCRVSLYVQNLTTHRKYVHKNKKMQSSHIENEICFCFFHMNI